MNGFTASGNRSYEKKTPEQIHIGIITRFIRPLTASSVLRARRDQQPDAGERGAADEAEDREQGDRAADAHVEDEPAEDATSTVTSTTRKTSRDRNCASR